MPAGRTEQVYKLIVSCFVSRMDGKAEVSILLTKINKQYHGQNTDHGKDAPNNFQNRFHAHRILLVLVFGSDDLHNFDYSS